MLYIYINNCILNDVGFFYSSLLDDSAARLYLGNWRGAIWSAAGRAIGKPGAGNWPVIGPAGPNGAGPIGIWGDNGATFIDCAPGKVFALRGSIHGHPLNCRIRPFQFKCRKKSTM